MGEFRRNRSQFVPIGSVIDKLMRQYRPTGDRELLKVWDIWEEAVGRTIAINARPAAIKGGTLLIHVASSTWLHHLRFLEKELVDKLNKSLGQAMVRKVVLKVGAF